MPSAPPSVVVAGIIAGTIEQEGMSVSGPKAFDRVPKWVHDDLRTRSTRPLRDLTVWFPHVFALRNNVLHLALTAWESAGAPTSDDCLGALVQAVVSGGNELPLDALAQVLPVGVVEELMRRSKLARDAQTAVQLFLNKNTDVFAVSKNKCVTLLSLHGDGADAASDVGSQHTPRTQHSGAAAQSSSSRSAAQNTSTAEFSRERRGMLVERTGNKWFISDDEEEGQGRYFVFGDGPHFMESGAADIGMRVAFFRSNKPANPGGDRLAGRVRLLAAATANLPPRHGRGAVGPPPSEPAWSSSQGYPNLTPTAARNGGHGGGGQDVALAAQTAAHDAALESLVAKSEDQLSAHKRDGCVVLIDHSYLVIEGGLVAARRAKLDGDNDPRWRVSMDKLVEVVLSSGSAFGGARPSALLQAFGSVRNAAAQTERAAGGRPLGTAPGGSFLEQVAMETTVRSGWTGKEKQVDHKIVRAMAMDLGAILCKRDLGVPCPNRTYCIVSGDGDFLDVVKMAVEHDIDVEVWCWSSSRASTYIRLAKHSPRLRVYHLDDYVERFSFSETLAPTPPPTPPPGRSLVLCVPADTSKSEARACAQRVHGFLQRLQFAYDLHAGAADDMRVLLVALSTSSLDAGTMGNVVVQARDQAMGAMPRAQVLAFPDFTRRHNMEDFAWTHVQSTNSMAALLAVFDDSAFEAIRPRNNNSNGGKANGNGGGNFKGKRVMAPSPPATPAPTPTASSRVVEPPDLRAPENHGYQAPAPAPGPPAQAFPLAALQPAPAAYRREPASELPAALLEMHRLQEEELRRQEQLRQRDESAALQAVREVEARERCAMREFCVVGLACPHRHSAMERAFFEQNGGKSPIRLRKTEYCRDADCYEGSTKRMYCADKRHGSEKALCLRCLNVPCVGYERCLDIAESRPLITESFDKLDTLSLLGYM